MICWDNIGLNDIIYIDDKYMNEYGIEKIIPPYNDYKDTKELWKYCNFYRHKEWNKKKKYMVSTFGRVLNVKKNKLLSISKSSGYSSNALGIRYSKVNIWMNENEYAIYYIHNLMAHTFLKVPKKKNIVVDHIDENPSHNYLWNIQFVTRSENINLHNMRMAQKFIDEGINITKKDNKYLQKMINLKNGKIINTRFSDDEIRHICKMIADGHKSTYIYNKLVEENPNDMKINYERIRTLYKHIMGKRHSFSEIARECGVIYPEEKCINPYLKEKGSVNASIIKSEH